VQIGQLLYPSTIIIIHRAHPHTVLCCALLYSTSTSLFFYSRSRYSRYNHLFLLSLRRFGQPSTPASAIFLRSIRFDDASCPSKASEIRSLRNSLCARSSNYRVKTRLPLLLLPRLQSSTISGCERKYISSISRHASSIIRFPTRLCPSPFAWRRAWTTAQCSCTVYFTSAPGSSIERLGKICTVGRLSKDES